MTTHNQTTREKLAEALSATYKANSLIAAVKTATDLDESARRLLATAQDKSSATIQCLLLVKPTDQDKPIGLTNPGTGYHGEEARIQEFPLSFLRQAAKNAENNPPARPVIDLTSPGTGYHER